MNESACRLSMSTFDPSTSILRRIRRFGVRPTCYGVMRRWSRLVMVMARLCVVACNRRGLNFDCMWVPESPTRLDVRSQANTHHLFDDLCVAEELAMRYGDRMAGTRLIETFGSVSRRTSGPPGPSPRSSHHS